MGNSIEALQTEYQKVKQQLEALNNVPLTVSLPDEYFVTYRHLLSEESALAQRIAQFTQPAGAS